MGVPAAGCPVIWGGSPEGALGCWGGRSFLEGALGGRGGVPVTRGPCGVVRGVSCLWVGTGVLGGVPAREVPGAAGSSPPPGPWGGVPAALVGEVAMSAAHPALLLVLLSDDVRQRHRQGCWALGHCQQPSPWIPKEPPHSWGAGWLCWERGAGCEHPAGAEYHRPVPGFPWHPSYPTGASLLAHHPGLSVVLMLDAANAHQLCVMLSSNELVA